MNQIRMLFIGFTLAVTMILPTVSMAQRQVDTYPRIIFADEKPTPTPTPPPGTPPGGCQGTGC